jgi:hypothetical protein
MGKLQDAINLLKSESNPENLAEILAGLDLSILKAGIDKAKSDKEKQEKESAEKIGKEIDKIKGILTKIGFVGTLVLSMSDGTWQVKTGPVKARGPKGRRSLEPSEEEIKAFQLFQEGKIKIVPFGEKRKNGESFSQFRIGETQINTSLLISLLIKSGLKTEKAILAKVPELTPGQVRGVLFRTINED